MVKCKQLAQYDRLWHGVEVRVPFVSEKIIDFASVYQHLVK